MNKPIIVKKNVRHTFTPEETAQLNVEFRQAYANMKAVEADVASERSRLKARIDEAQAQMDLKNATLQAGYEMRVKELVLIYSPTEKKKFFYLPEDIDKATGDTLPDVLPVACEEMSPDDFQQDLLQSDAAFDDKTDLSLWDVGSDKGKIVVGRQGKFWYAAARCNVGMIKVEERLDSEQLATKKRFDAIAKAGKRIVEFLKVNLGKDSSEGFVENIMSAVEAERDKVE